MEEQQPSLAEQVLALWERGEMESLLSLLCDEHPVDLAQMLEQLPAEQRVAVFALLDNEQAGAVLDELHAEVRDELLDELTPQKTSDIVEEMPSDEAADLLGDLPREEAEQILELMADEEAEQVQELLEYPDHSAGGLMAAEVPALPSGLTVDQAIARLRELAAEAETIHYLYVVGPDDRLDGVLSLRELLVARPDQPLRDIMEREVVAVSPDMDQEDVARVVARYNLLAVPVVDEQRRLLGIVTVDDVADVMEQEAAEDMYAVTGSAPPEAEAVSQPLPSLLAARAGALAVILAGGLIAAFLVRLMAQSLHLPLALAVFVPLVVLVGAGVANQSAALIVKEFAAERAEAADINRSVWRELRAGAWLALASGLVAGLLCLALYGLGISVVIGTAIAVNVLAAVLIGTLLPLVLAKFGADPSRGATPLVSALADLAALAIYLAVGGALAHLLG